MRVLHIVAADRHTDADATATSDVLLATMVCQDPGLVLDELDLAGGTPVPGDRQPRARIPLREVRGAGAPGDELDAVVGRILAADVIVLCLGAASPAELPDGLRRLLALLGHPEALLARAAVRRSGRRVGRRMVLVVPPAGASAGRRDIDALVRAVDVAFHRLDVIEVGVIAGGAVAATPVSTTVPERRAGARWWSLSRVPDRKAS